MSEVKRVSIWQWLGTETNSRAISILLVGIPAALAAWAFVIGALRPEAEQRIVIDAADFWDQDSVNVGPTNGEYAGLVLNQPPYEKPGNSATYKVALKVGGRFQLSIQYAAKQKRPLKVEVNDKTVITDAANGISGEWSNTHLRWDKAGEVDLSKGDNFIRLYTEGNFPHVKTLKLSRVQSR